jgi:hypothetical protein
MERLARGDTEKGDRLLTGVSESLHRQARIRQELETMAKDPLLGSSVRAFLQEEQIMTSSKEDILGQLEGIQKWWQQVKSQPAGFGTANSNRAKLPRSDVFPMGGSSMPTTEPVVRILATEHPRRRKAAGGPSSSASSRMMMRRTQPTDIHGQALDTNDDESGRFPQPATFRKWGDDLLPSDTLIYPSVAPEMPPDIHELLRQRGGGNQAAITAN